MMYGIINTDRLCTVLQQILSQRDPKVEVHVKVVSEKAVTEGVRQPSGSRGQSALDETPSL